jgi:hypothetical protein
LAGNVVERLEQVPLVYYLVMVATIQPLRAPRKRLALTLGATSGGAKR